MQSNLSRRDGSTVLKDINNINKKGSYNSIYSNTSLIKSKAIPQTTSNISTSKIIKNIPSGKGPALFFYPSTIPSQLQDVPLTISTTRNNVPTKIRPANEYQTPVNSSLTSLPKQSKSKSPGPVREQKPDPKTVKVIGSRKNMEQSVEKVNTSERETTPVRQLTIKEPTVLPEYQSENSQAQNGTRIPTSNELDIVITTITKVNPTNKLYVAESTSGLKKILNQFKSDRYDSGSTSPRSAKKITSTSTTQLPSIRPPIRDSKASVSSNHGSRKNSPVGTTPSSQVNFEFCKKSESATKITRSTTRENSPRGVTPKGKDINLPVEISKIDSNKTPPASKSLNKKLLSTSSPKSNLQTPSLIQRNNTLIKNENLGLSKTSAGKNPYESERNKSANKNVSPIMKTHSNLTFKSKQPLQEKKDQSPSIERKPNLMQNLSDEERHAYGDRFPLEYMKLDFLGRGGFALVWLGASKKSGKKYAVKQILKNNLALNESQIKELKYGKHFFENGAPKEKFRQYEGIKHIACFADYKSTRFDDWHVFELGGTTLSKQVFEIKGEFYKSERIYGVKIKHLAFLKQLKGDDISFRLLIKQIAQVLQILADEKIVHCDLKPDNILIDTKDKSEGKPFTLKIIDFGSAYDWSGKGQIGMATPEYMPPEFLNLLFANNGMGGTAEVLAQSSHPWSIDVWSLGALILEIITGIPLWLSLRCKIEVKGKDVVKTGLFAIKGRAYDKIYLKQKIVMDTLDEHLQEYIDEFKDCNVLKDLINKMMRIDPLQRISPSEILKHPYLETVSNLKVEDMKTPQTQINLSDLKSHTQENNPNVELRA